MTAPSAVPGACFCGAVRFEVELPTLFCVHCHCTMCRRNHGAAFVTWFGVAKEKLKILDGETLLTSHHSSTEGVRSFCSRCGTPLFCELAHYPGTIDVTLASMQAPIDREPEANVFFDSHVPWLERLGGLPKLSTE